MLDDKMTEYIEKISDSIYKAQEKFAREEIERIIADIFKSGDIMGVVQAGNESYHYSPYHLLQRERAKVATLETIISNLCERAKLIKDDTFVYGAEFATGKLMEVIPEGMRT